MKRKAIIISILAIVMSLFVGAVAAQEDVADDRPGPRRGLLDDIINVITESTGLTPQEIREQLQDGSTLTQVIENAGGDANAIITQVQTEVNNRIAELFTTEFDFPEPGDRLRDRVRVGVLGELSTAITDATGLEMQDIMQQLQDGAILADIITENGGDVDTVIATVVDSVTAIVNEHIASGELTQEQGDTILENLEQRLTDWINGDEPLPQHNRPDRGNGRGNN